MATPDSIPLLPPTPDEIPTKRCTRCGRELPATVEYFHLHSIASGILRSYCKECAKKYTRKRSERLGYDVGSRERKREQATRRCKSCNNEYPNTLEYFRSNGKKGLHTNCRACERARVKVYQQQHKGQEEYQEKRRRYNREYREKHRDELNAYTRAWRRENRAIQTMYSERKRARKRSLPHKFTIHDWQRALDYFEHCCAICGKAADMWTALAADHWIPLSSPDCPGTIPTNIIPLCHTKTGAPAGMTNCNNAKHNRNAEEWLIERYGKRKAKVILARINAYFEWMKKRD